MTQTQTQDGGSTSGGSGPAVVYFAKAPRPGSVKTRLCPPLTPAEAAGLYRGFLAELIVPVPGARTLVYAWPEDGLEEVGASLRSELEVRPQRGGDLWQRLRACFAELFAAGHAPIVVRNTDSPDLPVARVHDALAAARPGRVVLGPDRGGGYYLVALAVPCPELFDGLDGVAPAAAFEATAARARSLGLAVHRLPLEADVDTFDDLLELWRRRRSDT